MRLPIEPHYKDMVTENYVICEICGKKYQSLTAHIIRKHGISVWEYKEHFGYDIKQPLECGWLQRVRHDHIMANKTYKNLRTDVHNWKKGHTGRTIHRQQSIERYRMECEKMSADPLARVKRSRTLRAMAKEHNPIVNIPKKYWTKRK